MLLALKSYLAAHPSCSVDELSREFATPATVVKQMLARLEQRTGQRVLQEACGGCQLSCSSCPLRQLKD